MTDRLHITDPEALRVRALAIWREREKRFPPFAQRMAPDDLDYASGAWGHCLRAAVEQLSAEIVQRELPLA